LGRVFRPTLAIQSGMAEFAAAAAALPPVAAPRWAEWRKAARAEYEAGLEPNRLADAPALDLGRVMTWLRERLPDDAIVTSDAGNFSGWPNRFLQYRRPGRQLGPTSGAMGYGVPAAVAASLVHPDRLTVGFCGDGGFLMTGRVIGTGLKNPDFLALAGAYGAFGARVDRTEEFAPAFEAAVASRRAAIIALTVDPEMITTRTTLSALRRQA